MKTKIIITGLLLCFFSTAITFASTQANSENALFPVQEPSPTIIELLQNGESYIIEITSIGCFNGTQQTLIISKKSDVLSVNFSDSLKVLSQNDIKAIINFEQQLRALDIGACTTVDTYVLRFGGETFQTSDGTCNWNGGKKLLQQLNLV